MWVAAFIGYFLTVCYAVWLSGNKRFYWAAVVITGQTMGIYIVDAAMPSPSLLTGMAVVHWAALIAFVWGSTQSWGKWLGTLSAISVIICILGAWGVIPIERGLGFWDSKNMTPVFSVYNWDAIIQYLQAGIIGFMAYYGNTSKGVKQ